MESERYSLKNYMILIKGIVEYVFQFDDGILYNTSMRDEIKSWILQSREDYDTAIYNFDGGIFYASAFFCQQAVEKALKALFLYETEGDVPKSHSLIYLAKNTSTPEKFHSFLRELTPKFIDTRYPDASVDLPSKIYDAENVKNILEKSKEVLKWIESILEEK